MNGEDIIRMAREAGLGTVLCHNSVEGDRVWIEGADWHDELERFAALVAAAERKAILQMSREQWFKTQADFEAAIRARNNT